jgi:hypothetical protein
MALSLGKLGYVRDVNPTITTKTYLGADYGGNVIKMSYFQITNISTSGPTEGAPSNGYIWTFTLVGGDKILELQSLAIQYLGVTIESDGGSDSYIVDAIDNYSVTMTIYIPCNITITPYWNDTFNGGVTGDVFNASFV